MPCSLNPGHLYSFSLGLTTAQDVRKLGFKILPGDTHIVDRELNCIRPDISNATYHILIEWFKRQRNPKKAYRDLLNSLGEIQMNQLAETLKYIVEGGTRTSNLEPPAQKTEVYVSYSEEPQNIEDVFIDGQRNQQSTDVMSERNNQNNQFNVQVLLMLVVLIGTLGFFNMHVSRNADISAIKELQLNIIEILRQFDPDELHITSNTKQNEIAPTETPRSSDIPVIRSMAENEIPSTELLKKNIIEFLEKWKHEDLQLINRMHWKDLDIIRKLSLGDITIVEILDTEEVANLSKNSKGSYGWILIAVIFTLLGYYLKDIADRRAVPSDNKIFYTVVFTVLLYCLKVVAGGWVGSIGWFGWIFMAAIFTILGCYLKVFGDSQDAPENFLDWIFIATILCPLFIGLAEFSYWIYHVF